MFDRLTSCIQSFCSWWGDLHCMGLKISSVAFKLRKITCSKSLLLFSQSLWRFCCLVHRLVSRGRLLDCGLPLAAEFQRGLGRLAARSYEVLLSLLGGTGHEILQDVVDSHDAQKNTSKGTILKAFPGVGVIWHHKG